MKKLIQICSVLSLLFVFTAVSAQAQSVRSYEANIPFDFNIGQKSYKTGDYVIKITKNSTRSVALSLEDKEGNNLHSIHVLDSGDVSQSEPKLVFNRYENQLFLSKIVTKRDGFVLGMSNVEKQLAKQQKREVKTQIAMVKPNK